MQKAIPGHLYSVFCLMSRVLLHHLMAPTNAKPWRHIMLLMKFAEPVSPTGSVDTTD